VRAEWSSSISGVVIFLFVSEKFLGRRLAGRLICSQVQFGFARLFFRVEFIDVLV